MSSTYHRLAAALLTCALCLAAGASATPASAKPASAAPSTLVIEGAGNGHGVGMSQDGALGYAKHGWTYEQILTHYYTGTTIGQAPAKATVRVLVGGKVVKLPLERYVRGVVSAEVPSNWPLAALEAQAIASRTYALTAHAGGSRFDVYADTRSQVYRGVAAETSQTNAAIAATSGQIVLYNGKPAVTYFFASSGGMTENIEDGFLGAAPEPWLRAVPDSYETASSRWTVNLSFSAAARRLRGLFRGSFRGVEVIKRGASPRILSVRVLGSTSATVVSGPTLAGRLGLSSTWEYFSVRANGHLKAEPDHSGQTRNDSIPAPGAPPATSPAPAPGNAGGVSAVVQSERSSASSPGSSGGTATS